MKKGMILILSVFFLGMFSAKAASSCSYQEQASLNNIASQIKASYEVKEGVLDQNTYGLPDVLIDDEENYQATYHYFEVSILNITEETYVIISNDIDNTKYTVGYSDTTDGIFHFDWKNLSNVTSIMIEVYSSDKTACANEKYRVFYLKLPKSNAYYNSPLCEGNESFYLCKEFIASNEPDFKTFETKINDYKAGRISDAGEEKAVSSNSIIKDHIVEIIVGGIVIVGVIFVITLNKKRSVTYGKKK